LYKEQDKEIKSTKSRRENFAKKTIFVIQTAMQIHVAMFTVYYHEYQITAKQMQISAIFYFNHDL